MKSKKHLPVLSGEHRKKEKPQSVKVCLLLLLLFSFVVASREVLLTAFSCPAATKIFKCHQVCINYSAQCGAHLLIFKMLKIGSNNSVTVCLASNAVVGLMLCNFKTCKKINYNLNFVKQINLVSRSTSANDLCNSSSHRKTFFLKANFHWLPFCLPAIQQCLFFLTRLLQNIHK